MAVDVEGITPSLGYNTEPFAVNFALPFDATERMQMALRTMHNVVKENVIQLSCCPLVLLVGNQQIIGRISPNPLAWH